MGFFSHDDKLEQQFGNISISTIKDLNDEFYAGFSYGTEEYSGSWESKNWKDDLEKFAKVLQMYDRILFLADAKNIGIHAGRLNVMMNSPLIYAVTNDDKAAGILVEIIDKLKGKQGFNMKSLKVMKKLNTKKLSPGGRENHKKILTAMQD